MCGGPWPAARAKQLKEAACRLHTAGPTWTHEGVTCRGCFLELLPGGRVFDIYTVCTRHALGTHTT